MSNLRGSHPRKVDALGCCAEEDCSGAEGEMGEIELMQDDSVRHHEIAPTTSVGLR